MAKRTQYYCPFLTPSALPPLLSRESPRTPAGGEVEAPLSKGAGRVSGLGDSDGLCVAAHSRAISAREKRPGCRPPSPLSSATPSRPPVGAGHARPAPLPFPPRILCIVGRQATGPLHNRPAPSNIKITCLRPLAGRLQRVEKPPSAREVPRRGGGREPCHSPKYFGQPYSSLPHRLRAEPPRRGGQGVSTPFSTVYNLPATSRRQVVFVLNSFRFLFF